MTFHTHTHTQKKTLVQIGCSTKSRPCNSWVQGNVEHYKILWIFNACISIARPHRAIMEGQTLSHGMVHLTIVVTWRQGLTAIWARRITLDTQRRRACKMNIGWESNHSVKNWKGRWLIIQIDFIFIKHTQLVHINTLWDRDKTIVILQTKFTREISCMYISCAFLCKFNWNLFPRVN